MSNNTQNRGTPVSATASGAGTVSAFLGALTGQTYHITDINGSSVVAANSGTWALLGGTTGTTVYWQGAGAVVEIFSEPIYVVGSVSFYVNGTTATYANISGYVL